MSSVTLPVAPPLYDATEERATRAEIERLFRLTWQSGSDLKLLRGERLFASYAHDLNVSGTDQASATPLTATLNHIATTSGASPSARLRAALAGLTQVVINRAGGAVSVWGEGADTINGSATTAFSVNAGTVVTFYCPKAGSWFA